MIFIEQTLYTNLVKIKPTQWEIGQLSDFFSENPARRKILLGLLKRGVNI